MRFKAKIRQDLLAMLSSIIAAMEKIGSTCIIHLSPETMWMTAQSPHQNDLSVFAELKKDVLFTEYRIESQVENCIMFEINATILLRALTSVKSAPFSQLKLTKRQGQPCLCIETRTLEIDVVHDAPIKVLRAQEFSHYQAPSVPQPQVQLELPRGRNIRTVVDRMKAIDRVLHIEAEMTGKLVFRVEKNAGEAVIKTHYNGLTPRFESMDEATAHNNKANVKVELRKMSQALHLYSVQFETVICCVIEGSMLVLHTFLSQDLGFLTFYLPVLAVADGD